MSHRFELYICLAIRELTKIEGKKGLDKIFPESAKQPQTVAPNHRSLRREKYKRAVTVSQSTRHRKNGWDVGAI
jgi:hypothetical protein